MPFVDDLTAWANRVSQRAERYAEIFEEEFKHELGEMLMQELPSLTPIDTGRLARSFAWRSEPGALVFSTKEIYAWAAFAHRGQRIADVVIEAAEQLAPEAAARAAARAATELDVQGFTRLGRKPL